MSRQTVDRNNVRVPKLAVRNRPASSGVEGDTDPASPVSTHELTFRPRSSANAPATPTAESSAFDGWPASPRASTVSTAQSSDGRRASIVSDASAHEPQSHKKKKSSMFNFLTVKEPSALALEQFAEQQRKQAAAKGGKASVVGVPGVPTQKLPPTVPKVNSKWDGLPQGAREAEKARRSSMANSDRYSRSTYNSSVIYKPSGARAAPNSIASSSSTRFGRQSDNSLTDSQKDSFAAYTDMISRGHSPQPRPGPAGQASGASSTPYTAQDLPQMSCFFDPDFLGTSTEGKQSSEPSTPPEPSPITPSDFSQSGTLSPQGPSQSRDTLVLPTREVRKIPSAQGFLAGEAQELQVPEGDDHGRILIYPPHEGASTSQQSNPTAPSEPTSSYATSISRPSTDAQSFMAASSRPSSVMRDTDTISIAESTAPSLASSVAPSVLSARWFQTPKERLGLGGPTIRRTEAVPWEQDEEEGGRSGATPGLTPGAAERSKKKSRSFGFRR